MYYTEVHISRSKVYTLEIQKTCTELFLSDSTHARHFPILHTSIRLAYLFVREAYVRAASEKKAAIHFSAGTTGAHEIILS